eukprot:TRINITY_DN126076_c0_g1_i1.p1 TRINITY_DN126076_c0_g1~~TRINITY_DN126076_c0_g1_i1.p1  ORF type:complete len:303 (+),score=86.05 TRINITY_DN126076_c0_g1_i1:102-1010(+)
MASTRGAGATDAQQFVIKNTFLDLDVGEGENESPRRSSSLPPALRNKNKENNDLETKSFASARSEEDTTDAADSRNDNDSDAAECWADMYSPRENMFGYNRTADGYAGEDPQPPPPPAPVVPRTSLRTKLNSGAKLWQPGAAAPAPAASTPSQDEVFMHNFENQVANIVHTVQDALVANGQCVQVDAICSGVHEGSCRQGWAIVATVPAAAMQYITFMVMLAKDVLLNAAEQSDCTYVLGYKKEPLEMRPQGFKTTLCAMQDESQACWDIYGEGICRRGSSCRWQHPPAFSSFAVIFKTPDA